MHTKEGTKFDVESSSKKHEMIAVLCHHLRHLEEKSETRAHLYKLSNNVSILYQQIKI